jgi:undecaprenyl-phosphate 4-deoxy-4-formamido-L-arabinose transferase
MISLTHPNQPHTCSVVIPVYNGEKTLAELVVRLEKVLSSLATQYEVVLVNDGSTDQSWAVIADLAVSYPWVTGLNLMKNYGQHNALLCGIREAQYSLIVTMDDDLQNPPEEIPKLWTTLLENDFDVVYGTPEREQHGLWRNLASQITKLALQTVMGADNARKVSAFRIFRSEVCKSFQNFQGPYVSIDILLAWGTSRFGSVTVTQAPRSIGESNYTFRKLITHAMNMMTGFSTFPLQIASLVGFAFTLFGIFVLVYVVGRYLIQGGSVPGFPFLASIVAIFSGATLFALGIIGEYLARMYFRLMDKPSYTIRTTTRKP